MVSALRRNDSLAVLVRKLSDEDLETIAQSSQPHFVAAGTAVVEQGDTEVNEFYVVEDGELLIEFENQQLLCPGSSFGELALLGRAPQPSTIRAKTPCKLWSLNSIDLNELLKDELQRKIKDYVPVLRSVNQFACIAADELSEIASSLLEVTNKDGRCIQQQGCRGEKFYILRSGSVSIEVDSRRVALLRADPSSSVYPYFGETALLENTACEESICSVGISIVLVVDRTVFLKRKELWSGYKGPSWKERLTETYRRSDLQRVKKLGKGMFGEVNLVLHIPSGLTFALKTLKKSKVAELKAQRCVLNEKMVLRLIDSNFLVKAAAMFNRPAHIEFLMEAVLGGEVFNVYQTEKLYGHEAVVRFHSGCIVRGLQHLHERHIMYRDLKPENLILDSRGYCKICDFGLAKFCLGLAYTFCGTPEYLAPEIGEKNGYTKAVDWWSLGILVYELMMGDAPFRSDNPMQIVAQAKSGIQNADWPAIVGLWGVFVKDMCQQKPSQRLPMRGGVKALEEHGWFSKDASWSWPLLDFQKLQAPFRPKMCCSASEIAENQTPTLVDEPSVCSDWASDFEELQGPPPQSFIPFLPMKTTQG